jgi:hypothetical protein
MKPKAIAGAAVLVYVSGRLYGRCTSFSWASATPRRKVRTIDVVHPLELAATTVDVTWNMGIVRLRGDGGAQGGGLATAQIDISKEKYFTLQLIEKLTGTTLFQCNFCQADSESWNVMSKGLVEGTVTGSGILWNNENS